MHCSCGVKVKNEKQWREHYLLSKPSVVRRSRLLPWMTIEKEEKSIADAKQYKIDHQFIK